MPKGVYDRATSAWRPRERIEDPPELVARVRELYELGHTMREVADLAGTTVKVLQRLMPQNGIARRAAVKREQGGSQNHMWRGADASYQAFHLRVEVARGKPSYCTCCGTDDPSRKYEWANLMGHYEDVDDYARFCTVCHRRFDAAQRSMIGAPLWVAPKEVMRNV